MTQPPEDRRGPDFSEATPSMPSKEASPDSPHNLEPTMQLPKLTNPVSDLGAPSPISATAQTATSGADETAVIAPAPSEAAATPPPPVMPQPPTSNPPLPPNMSGQYGASTQYPAPSTQTVNSGFSNPTPQYGAASAYPSNYASAEYPPTNSAQPNWGTAVGQPNQGPSVLDRLNSRQSNLWITVLRVSVYIVLGFAFLAGFFALAAGISDYEPGVGLMAMLMIWIGAGVSVAGLMVFLNMAQDIADIKRLAEDQSK